MKKVFSLCFEDERDAKGIEMVRRRERLVGKIEVMRLMVSVKLN